MDPNMGTNTNPVIIPKAPLSFITNKKANTILTNVPAIIIIGSILVFNEEITIDRNNVITVVDVINIMDKINNVVSSLNTSPNHIWIKMNRIQQVTMPIDVNTKEAFTNFLVTSISFCKKLFPRNLWTPNGMPIDAKVEKITVKEIIVEERPIASGLEIFDIINQKIYPDPIETNVSI
jgi:hypothetical protein